MSAEIAITLYVLVIPLVLYLAPALVQFSKNKIMNLIFRDLLWVIATFLMVLNAGIMATIASNASLSVTSELFFYLWFMGKLGYILVIYMFVSLVIKIVNSYTQRKQNRRMGYDE